VGAARPVDVDQVVLGAGFFGMVAADLAARRGRSVLVVDPEPVPLTRASFANQARIHLGYHYPRSLGTALQAIEHRDRFQRDYADCVNDRFTKLYAIARFDSLTSAAGFEQFCHNVDIPAERVDPQPWFADGSVEAVFACDEAAFDAARLRARVQASLDEHVGVAWALGARVLEAGVDGASWSLALTDGTRWRTSRVVNATYAATNGVLATFGQDPLPIGYELCELALGRPSPALAGVGITVMDGPFFSVMPFGHRGLHSLSAVDHTPRLRSDGPLPEFPCQRRSPTCRPDALDGCGSCPVRPASAADEMWQVARRFLRPELDFTPTSSVVAIRPVLRLSDVDDSRPTLLYEHRRDPDLVTVLSGKINTVYDLEHLD